MGFPGRLVKSVLSTRLGTSRNSYRSPVRFPVPIPSTVLEGREAPYHSWVRGSHWWVYTVTTTPHCESHRWSTPSLPPSLPPLTAGVTDGCPRGRRAQTGVVEVLGPYDLWRLGTEGGDTGFLSLSPVESATVSPDVCSDETRVTQDRCDEE